MKRVVFASAVVAGLGLVASASAAERSYQPSRTPYLQPTGVFSSEGSPIFPYSTGFEAVQGFTNGQPVNGQAGWTSFNLTNAQPVVSSADPQAGTQHLRQSKVISQPSGSFVGAFSPLFGNVPDNTSSRTTYFFKANGVTPGPQTGGAEYLQAAQEGQGVNDEVTWQVNFSFTGDVLVTDNTDADPDLEFVDTGLNWVAGQYYRVDVDLDIAANQIRYFVDGTLRHTTVNGIFAGTSVRQVILLSDNFFDVNENGNYDTLNVAAIPEPASIAALSAVGAFGLRRRRR